MAIIGEKKYRETKQGLGKIKEFKKYGKKRWRAKLKRDLAKGV